MAVSRRDNVRPTWNRVPLFEMVYKSPTWRVCLGSWVCRRSTSPMLTWSCGIVSGRRCDTSRNQGLRPFAYTRRCSVRLSMKCNIEETFPFLGLNCSLFLPPEVNHSLAQVRLVARMRTMTLSFVTIIFVHDLRKRFVWKVIPQSCNTLM